jgi:superfamily II RNA helicase
VKGKVGGRLTEAIQECQSIAKSLDRLQRRHGLEVSTTIVPNYAPIVLRWAEGDSWWDVLEWSGLEAGDLVRALRRTLDVARQLCFAPHCPRWLAQTCHILERQICRNELKESLEQIDLLAFSQMPEDDTENQVAEDDTDSNESQATRNPEGDLYA